MDGRKEQRVSTERNTYTRMRTFSRIDHKLTQGMDMDKLTPNIGDLGLWRSGSVGRVEWNSSRPSEGALDACSLNQSPRSGALSGDASRHVSAASYSSEHGGVVCESWGSVTEVLTCPLSMNGGKLLSRVPTLLYAPLDESPRD